MYGKDANNRRFFYEIYACYRSARTSFIGERSVADVQPGGQVENRFAGDARCKKKKKKKKDIRFSKLKIECQTTERIFEYSGPALIENGAYGKAIYDMLTESLFIMQENPVFLESL